MIDFIHLAMSLLIGVTFLAKSVLLFLTPIDDMYSDYRNTSDYGYNKFIRNLWFKRIVYLIIAIILIINGIRIMLF